MSKDALDPHRQQPRALQVQPLINPSEPVEISRNVPLMPPHGVEPVICSQAALGRFYGDLSSNTTGLAQKLKEQGILREFEPPQRRGEKYRLWFADLEQHKKALDEFSGNSGKRIYNKRKA